MATPGTHACTGSGCTANHRFMKQPALDHPHQTPPASTVHALDQHLALHIYLRSMGERKQYPAHGWRVQCHQRGYKGGSCGASPLPYAPSGAI